MSATTQKLETPQFTIDSTPTASFNKEEMIKTADYYHSLGIPIIPFTKTWNATKGRWEKQPVIPTWKKWQNEPQTDEEYRNLHLENYKMFGVVCGVQITIGDEPVYLNIVDRDIKDPDLPQTVKDQTLKAIKSMPTTQHEGSINGGQHLIYGSRRQTGNPKPSRTGMELLSLGSLAVMAPSEGYSTINDNSITVVNDAEAVFFKALEETGVYSKPASSSTLQINTSQTTPRPCIVEALKQQLTGGNGHRMRYTIAADYKRLGYSAAQIVDLFRNQTDFDPNETLKGIESADPNRTAKCDTIRSWGYCLDPQNCQWCRTYNSVKSEKENDDTPNVKQTAGRYLPTNNIVFEQVEGQQFLLNNGETATELTFDINGQNITFVPFPEENLLWSPCTATPKTQVNTKKLWLFVKNFIYKHLELPDEGLYDVLTAWTFATWIPEAWEVAPYVFFFGAKNSGKTRGLEALQLISYRAKTSVASTAPALFRSIEKYGCVPFIDEAETLNQKDNTDIIAVLNAGYRRRCAKVERCQKGDDEKQDLATFDVFGFKAIAGTQSLKNTLESRSIIINMAKNTRKVEPNINTKAAKSLRNALLQWRLETLPKGTISTVAKEDLTATDSFDNFDTFDDFDSKTRTSLNIPEELSSIPNGRVIELFTPLYKVAEAISDESVKKTIINYAKTVAGQQKTEENTSVNAELLLAILKCYDTVENSFISNKAISDEFNQDRPIREQLNGETLTSRIAALGLSRCRRGGKRGFDWDNKKLRALCKRYDLETYAEQYLKSPLGELSNLSKPSNPSPDATCQDQKCCDTCKNYDKAGCPQFFQKIPPNNQRPLKCYGFVPNR